MLRYHVHTKQLNSFNVFIDRRSCHQAASYSVMTNLEHTNNLKSSQDHLMEFATAQYRCILFIRKDNDNS